MATKKRKQNYAAREAHRKNVERAKVQEQAAKRKAFLDKYRRHLMIGIPAVIVLAIGIWLICKATIGPGGSIPNFFGSLQGVQDNWIVTNQGTTSSPRYYKMGEVSTPEGYTLDADYTISSDHSDQTFYFVAEDENAPIQTVYVTGVRNRDAAGMIEMVSGYNMYSGEPVISEDPIGGLEGHWILGLVNDDENAAESTEEAMTTRGFVPNCQTAKITAGSSAMITRSISRRVSVLVRICG